MERIVVPIKTMVLVLVGAGANVTGRRIVITLVAEGVVVMVKVGLVRAHKPTWVIVLLAAER